MAAEMDEITTQAQRYSMAATNRFFRCLTESVAADLRFLAQPGYMPAAQLAASLHQGTWRYLTSNAYENNTRLYQGAVQSLNRLRQDPACWVGGVAPDLGFAAVTHVAGAAAEAKQVRNAANEAIKLANADAQRRTMYGSVTGTTPNGVNRFNPECAPNLCFPSAIAWDLTMETGEPLAARSFAGNVEVQVVKGVPTNVFNLTTTKTVETMLGSLYGHKKLLGPDLGAKRREAQMLGKPVAMSQQEILDELKAAGSTSRGLVFVSYPPTPGNPRGAGHVFGARNVKGKVFFVDPSNSLIDATPFFEGGLSKFARTN